MVETALILMPLLLLLFSIVEVARGMWTYNTLAIAVKHASRVASVHGKACVEAAPGCQITIGSLVSVMQHRGVGLDLSRATVTFSAGAQSLVCSPLSTCVSSGVMWPPSQGNSPGTPAAVHATYSFQTMLSGLWGNSSLTGGLRLAASAHESIQF